MTTDKARSLTEQIEASVNQLAIETDEARQSELFQTWLNAMATFSQYSWNNQLLIALQRPAASSGQVAGFHAWRKLGRHVKKGAKGIPILAALCCMSLSGATAIFQRFHAGMVKKKLVVDRREVILLS